jgi:hypothetical protein
MQAFSDHAGNAHAFGVLGTIQALTDSHGHYVRAWVSRHDNGWEAWVCEDEHGDFYT